MSKTILLIDDDEVERAALRKILEAEPAWRLVEARDGQEGLDMLCDRLRPQLCVIDLTMPRLGGRELVERTHVEVVYVELPIEDPAAAMVAADLEPDGFGFLGVAPHFSQRGDLLRLAYLVEPLAREPIKTLGETEDRLVEYVLAEQDRLRRRL